MGIKRAIVSATTDSGGAATVYSNPITGEILAIRYIKPGAGNYADTVDFTITGRDSGQGLWTEQDVTASAARYPRSPIHAVGDGSAISGGYTPVVFVDEQVQIAIANGGDTKTGSFEIVYRDP